MALEAYLGKLTKTGEGGRRTLREYHPKSLVDATSVLETIKGANLETEEGLKGYSQLTGINPAKYSLRELEFFKRGQIKEVSRDLGAYVNGHFPKVVGELSEEEQIRQAINSSPECKLSSGSSEGAKKYDRARGHISQAMGIMEMIQERPREVLKHELETGSSLVGRYILENAAEYLGILNEEAKGAARNTVRAHGPAKFLVDTQAYLTQKGNELETKETELEAKLEERKETARMAKIRVTPAGQNPTPSAFEMVQITMGLNKERKELYETYAGLKPSGEFVQEIQSSATESIFQRLVDEEIAKRKAQEQTSRMAA
ncbi:hypothetical protein HN604_00100 [archaeon]|jgi:hypothetical protein|nr:hypothetical protein [archaeon]MBT6182494.1 hypothetical protein [archaeon]MBT6606420.1 hypothetical protein [archaeon]MBT7251411.1 hypothetical protein [archaeon]MBT7660466.1 hypothetical protein [archaeon]